jgi:hypothetical protein
MNFNGGLRKIKKTVCFKKCTMNVLLEEKIGKLKEKFQSKRIYKAIKIHIR